MKITDFLKENLLYLDGGMGTLLQERGLSAGELPERWNITHADVVYEIHRAYFNAGSHVVNTNTFGANLLKYGKEELDAIVKAALQNVRRAANDSVREGEKWVALDIGPTGRMLKPYGDLDFEDAVKVFAETVRLGVKYGADLIFIETMSDSYEAKAALLAAKENSRLPVFVSCAFGEDGKLLTGASPAAMVALLEGMGADAIGVNCSLGPRALSSVVKEYLQYASVPVILKPNAGLPRAEGGKAVFDVGTEEFAREVVALASLGVRAVGGCCGTTPAYIQALRELGERITLPILTQKKYSLISSYTHALALGDVPLLIGERINPTGKPRFKEALRRADIEYILREGLLEEEKGAHVLDVNVGLPEIDEPVLLERVVTELQAVCALPLQIDTADPISMERALRRYNGKAMINSVNGKRESMDAVFPLVKKYGGVVVALTLDEDGIPETAEGRLEIARRILAEGARYGLSERDIIFDPLAMAVSADEHAALTTLEAVKRLKEELGVNTSLGVSNVSFGLPSREVMNTAFFTMALSSGLSAAIMNVHSLPMLEAYHAYLALTGKDARFGGYIAFADAKRGEVTPEVLKKENAMSLSVAIKKGMKDAAATLCKALLKEKEPLSVIKEEIIPALDEVGDGFEKKTVYLPTLLMSAEAAKSAFDVIKEKMAGRTSTDKCSVVLATVKGDIHDIGKNIVKMLLENYGFPVLDLGRDASPESIVRAVKESGALLVGLSALMTTTVPAMEQTVCLLRKECPSAKIMVGGAVLTEEYAEKIGADAYGKDAMEAVRYAEKVNKDLQKQKK